MTKPIFIPLKREYFEAFATRTKREEFRPEGPRWNARTCVPGRPVVLSLGYAEPTKTAAWKDCYGDRAGVAACIEIELDKEAA